VRDTVAVDTLARLATSRMSTRASLAAEFYHSQYTLSRSLSPSEGFRIQETVQVLPEITGS